jgi:death-on-curing protein
MVDVDQDAAYGLVMDIASGKTEDIAVIAAELRSLHLGVS